MNAINLGIDFGSTYTVVSRIIDGKPQALQVDGQQFIFPSVVVLERKEGRRDKWFFGSSAKQRMTNPNTTAFIGFKMLLTNQLSRQALEKWNYTEEFTPEIIAQKFLEHVIQNVLARTNSDEVGELVVGAPVCWFDKLETIDARNRLREICSGLDKVGNVRIISEPNNAAAFFVWQYEQREGKPFEGDIFVADYGGGTLDTALASVEHINTKLKISTKRLGGDGENTDTQVGVAGIAFQRAVVVKAISETLGISEEDVEMDDDFLKAANTLESTLLCNLLDVEDIFKEYEVSDPEELKDEDLVGFTYHGENVEINYYHLYEVYHHLVQPVLKKVLDDSISRVGKSKNLHLALVGGFCNFYLVKKQILEYFHQGHLTGETHYIRNDESDREQSISLGAALFAEGVVERGFIAPYGIGMWVKYGESNSTFPGYAIHCNEEYIPGEIYIVRGKNREEVPMLLNNRDRFLINFSPDPENFVPSPMMPKAEFKRELEAVECSPMVMVGFSMDEEQRLTVYFYNYIIERNNNHRDEVCAGSVPMSTFKDSFEDFAMVNG